MPTYLCLGCVAPVPVPQQVLRVSTSGRFVSSTGYNVTKHRPWKTAPSPAGAWHRRSQSSVSSLTLRRDNHTPAIAGRGTKEPIAPVAVTIRPPSRSRRWWCWWRQRTEEIFGCPVRTSPRTAAASSFCFPRRMRTMTFHGPWTASWERGSALTVLGRQTD